MSAVLSASASVSSAAAVAAATASVLSASSLSLAALPVLHRTAQPISVAEFADALRAASPSRFPNARALNGRRVGLAISGGVDSMALAYLCSAMMRSPPQHRSTGGLCLADAPILGFNAMIIDHGLRAGSGAEAAAVGKEMIKMGHRHHVIKLRWPTETSGESTSSGGGGGPPTTAVETNARRLRYRHLAHHLALLRIVSLLLAHHQDDQHETVLMRLLSGYGLHGGIRGLRGMRPANDLPECYGMYGAHRSGFWDDQQEPNPYVVLKPTRRERRRIKQDLKAEIDYAVLADEIRAGGGGEWDRVLPQMRRPWDLDDHMATAAGVGGPPPPPLTPMDTEDQGIVAYRPLLAFGKDRLVATCMANGVTWFEDHTNADPTLTMRNALRHLVRHHALPAALQKPAMLQLAARSDAMARQDEAQARRLVATHGIIRAFSPNVGTLVVWLPRLQAQARSRPWRTSASSSSSSSENETERRRLHLRTVAALAIRSVLAYVTPEDSLTPVSQLQGIVDIMFPELAAGRSSSQELKDPKSFNICGVHCTPLQTLCAWFLSRAPYLTPALAGALAASATVPPHTGSLVSLPSQPRSLPFASFPAISLALRWNKPAAAWPWSAWGRWVLYDGRFWVRMRTRLPVVVSVQPFRVEDSKPFREALARGGQEGDKPDDTTDGTQLARFLAMLKAHAPGKVRYTLPGIYVAADIGWALRGEPYWPPAMDVSSGRNGQHILSRDDEAAHRHVQAVWERTQRARERAAWPAPDRPTQHLLALPTMSVHVPGLRKWVQWEVRYKKVDTGLLEASLARSYHAVG